jgi:predicted DNA-binding protein
MTTDPAQCRILSYRRLSMRSEPSLSLHEEIASQLNEFAKATGRPKGDIVMESLRLYFQEERLRKPKDASEPQQIGPVF